MASTGCPRVSVRICQPGRARLGGRYTLAALRMNSPMMLARGTFQAHFLLPSLSLSHFLCSLDHSSLLSMSEGMPWGMFLIFPILPQLPPEGIGLL